MGLRITPLTERDPQHMLRLLPTDICHYQMSTVTPVVTNIGLEAGKAYVYVGGGNTLPSLYRLPATKRLSPYDKNNKAYFCGKTHPRISGKVHMVLP